MTRKRFCPDCGREVEVGKRCSCKPARKRKPTAGDETRGKREPWRTSYNDKVYRQSRQQVISMAGGKCEKCGRVVAWWDGKRWQTSGMGGEVHHIKALRDGGGNGASNLMLLCKSCHGLVDAARRKHR